MHEIRIRGAREHNLKNVDLTLPRDKLVVITGLSGSGKSSLAFDTIYAEGQRRYVESLSAYARQFLELMQKPDVDSIEGLSPAISIEQKTTSRNPRSTVGTVTEIYDYMRLLWARAGVPWSPATGLPIEAQTVSQMVDGVMTMEQGTKILLLAPIARGRKGEYKKEFQDLKKKGYHRVKVNGTVYPLDEAPTLNKKYKHDIDVVVDRLVIRDGIEARLADSLEQILALSDGLAWVENAETGEKTTFSAKFSCPVSGFSLDEIEPRLFSFNSPFGACPTCDGLGVSLHFDPDLIVPDPDQSINSGAIVPWSSSSGEPSVYYAGILDNVLTHCQESADTPWKDLTETTRNTLLHGSGRIPIKVIYRDNGRRYRVEKPFEGIVANIARRWREADKPHIRDELARYQLSAPCDSCGGQRLKPEALTVHVGDKTIAEVSGLSISGSLAWFSSLSDHLSAKNRDISARILKEITERLTFLSHVGLGYLTLSRASGTLSGGESQRIRLASQIGSGLTGVLYVLDEPSIGLHQRDNERLLQTLRRLRDLGNTVLVVEHDEDAIRSADYLIDMGPGAGTHGGSVVAAGTPAHVIKTPTSLTGQYLARHKAIDIPSSRRRGHGTVLTVTGARANNLQDIDASIPLGTLTCVTGVSGGGKSSLVNETLYKALSKEFHKSREQPGPFKEITGLQHLDKVIDVNQMPIGRTPRSNPATYTGIFTPIREWFAALPDAKARGYKPGRFSFNVKGGRCESCQGDGVIKIEMHFLPDVYVTCDVCKGKRYNRETLEIIYKNNSISDILDMTVEEGLAFFEAVPAIRNRLELLQRVGLGYIHIGQQATTLSGGEAQRIKLSKELSRRATGKTLYILDEPTTGLHFEDIRRLLGVLQELVTQGNTVLVIEHNLDVIKVADWIIDMGPEGGSGGGHVIAIGTPEDIAACATSYTGTYLRPYLDRQHMTTTCQSE